MEVPCGYFRAFIAFFICQMGKIMKKRKTQKNSCTSEMISIGRILMDYRIALEALNRSPKTVSWYLSILKRFFLFLSDNGLLKPVEQIGRKELTAYLTYLRNAVRWPNRPEIQSKIKLSFYSIQGHARAIKVFFSWLLHEGLIEMNSLKHYRLPSVPLQLMGVLSVGQVKKLLSAIDRSKQTGCRDYLLILLLFDCGARISEALDIKIEDIDMESGFVRITGKGNRQRLVPLSNKILREISKFLRMSHPNGNLQPSEFLFALNGHTISSNGVGQMMHRLRDAAGLSDLRVSPHIFRHSCASAFIAAGGDPFVLRELLGHRSLSTTLRYVHLKPSDLRKQHSQYSPISKLFQSDRDRR